MKCKGDARKHCNNAALRQFYVKDSYSSGKKCAQKWPTLIGGKGTLRSDGNPSRVSTFSFEVPRYLRALIVHNFFGMFALRPISGSEAAWAEENNRRDAASSRGRRPLRKTFVSCVETLPQKSAAQSCGALSHFLNDSLCDTPYPPVDFHSPLGRTLKAVGQLSFRAHFFFLLLSLAFHHFLGSPISNNDVG